MKPAALSASDRFGLPGITARIEVWVGDGLRLELNELISRSAPAHACPGARVRIRFRRTFKSSRSLFFSQLRMDDPDEKTGFAGLIIRGETKRESIGVSIKTTSCTTVYLRCDWINPAAG